MGTQVGMESRSHDVIIVGGGLVGASLACALEPLGLKVALIEAVSFKAASQPSYDDRTLALSASSCKILEAMSIWPALRDRATAIREIHVRELGRPGHVILQPAELGLECFGYVVEARAFGGVMQALLPRVENLDVICPASVQALEFTDDRAVVDYSDEHGAGTISGNLLVGADGARSFVRNALGIESEQRDYRQTAVICNITPEEAHDGRAYECFTPSGPFAVMPHVGGRCGLIWCVDSERAEQVLDLPEADFLAAAHERFGNHLGAFVKVGKRSSYPLRLVRACEDIRERAVILGNAAHAIHPIGAQGFNLGLRDVAALAEVLAESVRRGAAERIGDLETLRRYSQWRVQDQRGTIAYSDGLARLFSNPSPAAAAARTAGLLAHAFIPALRRQLAVRAMGYRGRIPRLAMGEPL